MSNLRNESIIFLHCVEVPSVVCPFVWSLWNDIVHWNRWDASLQGTVANENGLMLGKSFKVIPKQNKDGVMVSVTSFIKGFHFTTTAVSEMGLFCVAHNLLPSENKGYHFLEHSVCIIRKDQDIPSILREQFQRDLKLSVEKLASLSQEQALTQ